MQGQENNDFLMHFRPKRMVFIMERNNNSCSIPIARSMQTKNPTLCSDWHSVGFFVFRRTISDFNFCRAVFSVSAVSNCYLYSVASSVANP